MVALTAKEIPEDRRWLNAQGLSPGDQVASNRVRRHHRPTKSKTPLANLATLLVVGVAVLACTGNGPSGTATSPTLGYSGVVPQGDVGVQRVNEVNDKSASSAGSLPYDSNLAMHDIFPWPSVMSAKKDRTLEEIARVGDRSLVPVLVEILQYMPPGELRERVATALRALTKQSFASHDWDGWMEWLGRNREGHEPPSEYVQWKIDLMVGLDPRFGQFLRPALEYSRIDLTEVVWGGVMPNEIPDLTDPPIVTAPDDSYLSSKARVFGVTIDGESRAYPLRIVNAHEMVNDVVGGEPISLAW